MKNEDVPLKMALDAAKHWRERAEKAEKEVFEWQRSFADQAAVSEQFRDDAAAWRAFKRWAVMTRDGVKVRMWRTVEVPENSPIELDFEEVLKLDTLYKGEKPCAT